MRAAIGEPWSNNLVKAHVNCLKLIKPSTYGRADLDLLHQRAPYAA